MVNVKKINLLLKKYFTVNGEHSVHEHTGLVTVLGEVVYREPSLSEMPVQFTEVTTFIIQGATGLKTLQGAPPIMKQFTINSADQLENLQGVPRSVNTFACVNCNNLKTLQGAESMSVNNMLLSNLPIKTLEGCPAHVAHIFKVDNCKLLQSLKGSPTRVNNNFMLLDNPIKSLAQGPDYVGGQYWISPYNKTVGMLPTLVAQQGVKFYGGNSLEVTDVSAILNDERWRGKGKLGMLNCAMELKKNNHVGNARW